MKFYESYDSISIQCTDGANTISWHGCDGAAGYRVYRAASRYGIYSLIALLKPGTLRYTDLTPTPDCCYKIYQTDHDGGEKLLCGPISYSISLFGENVCVLGPQDSSDDLHFLFRDMYAEQEAAQFDPERYAVLFKPGDYSFFDLNVGFYTHIAGLGASPDDTRLPNLSCLARWMKIPGDNNNATCNFWRSVENITVDNNAVWAVSQATSMRRVHICGDLALHDDYGWCSGGFLSDSVIDGTVDSGTQQQWLSRNDCWQQWRGENWNMVFVGLEKGCAPEGTWPQTKFTTVEKTPVIAEKPFLVYNEKEGYRVVVPELRTNSLGVSWANGTGGRLLDIDSFYIAKSSRDSAQSINNALSLGKNIIFTPGVYQIETPLLVTRPDTVILGLGLATLLSAGSSEIMRVADVDGVRIAGLLFDAGEQHITALLTVGEEKSAVCHADNPTVLSDMYFRVGGAFEHSTSVDCCVVINSNDVIGDNFWVWRADHGDGVGWNTNATKNGIIVNGDNVTFYALMVEHFHQYQTVWNGENGRTYFYQSETPYDVPAQSEWMSHSGKVNGCASYKVAESVKAHEAWGLGIYSFHRDTTVDINSVMEIPDAPDVRVHNCCAVMITGHPGISHVINNCGESAVNQGDRSIIIEYCNGEYTK